MMLGWLGWTVAYAVVIWGIDAAFVLLEPWLNDREPARAGGRRGAPVPASAWTRFRSSVSGCAHGGGRSARFWSSS